MRPNHHKLVLRLRQLRRHRELTQADMAKRVGIHINAYNAIEKGRATPALDTAQRIALVFPGETVDSVFEYVEVPEVPA